MDRFIDACISHHRSILLVLLLIFVAGTVSYLTIPKEREPDVQIPFIYVSITHEGISPEDAERLLIKPIEKELRSIEGVKEMTAYATEGRASVTLEFKAGFDSEKALADVRDKVDIAKAELPEETDEPEVNEINLSLFPIVNVTLSGDVPERFLYSVARDLRDRLEAIPNVLSVEIVGDREEVVEIIIDPLRIESYGLSTNILDSVASSFNTLVASGNLDNGNGRYSVKVPGLLEDLEDILSLPVKVNGESVVTVRDIAKVKKTYKDPDGFARTNGKTSVVLEVSKRTGTNIIETISQVKAVVAGVQEFWPENLQVTYVQDRSTVIFRIINDLQNNIILAIILVMLVILFFIGFKSAGLITVAIPGAFLMGILFLDYMGFTLNIVVLFSLILSVGMLVDSAIIVSEMADRKMTDGMGHKDAFAVAAKYMKWPIITSTITTLVVFMPLLFWPGIIGQFMKYLPITLIATLSSSFFMAIIFIPTLGSIFGKQRVRDKDVVQMIRITEGGDLSELKGFTAGYYRMLSKVLDNCGAFSLSIIGILVSVYIYYGMFGTGVEFFPNIEPENSQVQIRTRGNLSVYEKDELVKEVESKILDIDDVRVFYAKSGAVGETGRQSLPEDTVGVIQMEFADWRYRKKAEEIAKDIKERTRGIGGILIDIQDQRPGPKKDKPVEIEIRSHSPAKLETAIEKVLQGMAAVGGFTRIEDSRPPPLIEWNIDVNRELAARFGADIKLVGDFIKLVTNGLKITTYRPDDNDDEVDIRVRFPDGKRNVRYLDALKVETVGGAVPMSNFVTRYAKKQITTIRRTDGFRVLSIKAGVDPGLLANDQVLALKEWLDNEKLDSDVKVKFKGEDEAQQETKSFLSSAFILALFIMALILVTQFNSIFYMFIILSAVLLSTVGVIIGLIITNQPFGIVMCGVGIISLSGIVVNNNIIFIDTYKKLRLEGMEMKEALLRTGVQRLRPILLTAGTTVLGLLPMVIGMNINFLSNEVTFGAPSSQWWRQLSTSIAGGLTFATILTLFFTPGLIMLGQGLNNKNKTKSI